MKDPGGKEITARLRDRQHPAAARGQDGRAVGGLPLRVNKTDETDCTVAAMTALNPDTALVLTVAYAG